VIDMKIAVIAGVGIGMSLNKILVNPIGDSNKEQKPVVTQKFPGDEFYFDIPTQTYKLKLYYKKKW